jgi:endonuclease/exonuclease/phosphatase family metal-dependent hydrolase
MGDLRVLTLNIWNRQGPWEARVAAIRDGLARFDPHLVGMQEVLAPEPGVAGVSQVAEIAQGLGWHTAFGTAWSSGGIAFGNAVLSRWPIAESRALPLPNMGTDEQRCLLRARIEAPCGALWMFVTHLNWRLDEGWVREAQVQAIAEHLRPTQRDGELPPILVGDFNAEPDSDEIRYVRGLSSLGGRSFYLVDAFAAAGDGSRGATYCRRNPFAEGLREPDRRIDYVFVGRPDRVGQGDVTSARVCFDEPHHGVFASDHFGVLATLRVEDPPA